MANSEARGATEVAASAGGELTTPRVLVVVGGGTMGQGIAQVGLEAGFETRLVDLSDTVLADARTAIGRRILRARENVDERDRSIGDDLGRLSTTTDLATACGNAYAVIETVVEDLDIKVGVLRLARESSPPTSLLATNTSALSITQMAEAMGAPERLVGMHFFNPVSRMRLVEVIRSAMASDAALELAQAVARELGKVPVLLKDSPGFVASRINALIGNEAFCMLEADIASARDIDTALKLGLNHPMGPFELGDLVGWDVRLRVLDYLHSTLGEKYRPCDLLAQYVADGRLGRKVGRGVYEYPK